MRNWISIVIVAIVAILVLYYAFWIEGYGSDCEKASCFLGSMMANNFNGCITMCDTCEEECKDRCKSGCSNAFPAAKQCSLSVLQYTKDLPIDKCLEECTKCPDITECQQSCFDYNIALHLPTIGDTGDNAFPYGVMNREYQDLN